MLLTGLGVALTGLSSFAVVATLALDGALGPTTTWVLMLLTRGVVFGVGLAAIPVSAMAFVVATTSAGERTAGLSLLGAAQGTAVVVGPALGALAALAGLLGPVWAAPAVVALALVLVALLVPPSPPSPKSVTEGPSTSAGGMRPWDPRVRSWLLVGFLLNVGLGLVLFTLGFAMQDRGALAPDAAARATGAVSLACGLVLVAVQGALVPRLEWAPRRLLAVGVPCAALGLTGLALAPGAWAIAVAMVVVSGGLALASPGYVVGPTLAVVEHEQSAVAGLVTANNGLAFVVGPVLGGALYAAAYPLPYALAATVTLAGLVVLLLERRPTPAGSLAVAVERG